MASSYALSTYIACKAKRQRVQRDGGAIAGAIVPIMHPPGYGSGYSITSGARCWCHLGRKSVAWALRYSITSGARYYCHLGRISVAWALRYSITSGARCWCHLGRRISIAWALRYSITSGARYYCHLRRRISVAWAPRYRLDGSFMEEQCFSI